MDLFRPHLPTLVMGDFNSVPWGQVMKKFARDLQLQHAGGIEGTWPDYLSMPMRIRIDQALTSPDLAVVEQTVMPGHGSDHRAISVLLLQPSEANAAASHYCYAPDAVCIAFGAPWYASSPLHIQSILVAG